MKTAHYTFTTWSENAMASGFDGAGASHQAALVRAPGGRARTPGGDNVIDLTAWRAANLDLAGEEEPEDFQFEEEFEEFEEPEPYIPAPRVRKSRRAAFAAELASTVSVAAAALAIILRVVAF